MDATCKDAVRIQWDRAAAGWNAHASAIRAWLQAPTAAMLGMAGVRHGAHVLDVAAGSGDQTLAVAERVGPSGSVLATDLSPAILSLARQNAMRAGFAQVRTKVADGEDLGVEAASFDAAVCRLGLMLFPDPLRSLQDIHRALKPGSSFCAMVFSRPERNPCITILMGSALRHAGLPALDPFMPGGLLSLGRPGDLAGLFEKAGFRNVTTTTIDAPFRLPSARAYLDFVRSAASPIQQILARLDDARRDAAWAEMEERLSAFTTGSGWQGPNEVLLTSGRRCPSASGEGSP